jgi:hypothetical protein
VRLRVKTVAIFAPLLAAALYGGEQNLPTRTITRSWERLSDEKAACWREVISHSVELPHLSLHSGAVDAKILRLVTDRAVDMCNYYEESERRPKQCRGVKLHVTNRFEEVRCESRFERERFVSVYCMASADSGAHPASWSESLNFFIDDGRVRRVDEEQLFASSEREESFAALAWKTKAKDCPEQGTEGTAISPELMDEFLEHATITMSEEGVVFESQGPCGRYDTEVTIPLSVARPYLSRELRARLGTR